MTDRHELWGIDSTKASVELDDTPISPVLRPDVLGGVAQRLERDSIAAALFGAEAQQKRLGRFLLREHLGTGGMGTVFAAYDEQLDRKLALKLIQSPLSDGEAHQRLLQEARALARLSHPNVVQVYEVLEFDGQLCLAMEYLAGPTLREWLDSETRPWREVLAVFCAAARGLTAGHANGIIHRDFKPHNAMFDVDGRVRVLDFGLARVGTNELEGGSSEGGRGAQIAPADALALTRTGAVMGTPAYMAPEQFLGLRAGAHSDQFSLCVALWEALYGRRPFHAPDLATLERQVVAGKIEAPPSSTKVPKGVRRALERGLAVDPEARWPSLLELVAQLEDIGRRRRRRLVLATSAALALTLVTALVGAGMFSTKLRDSEARRELARAAGLASTSTRRLSEGRTIGALTSAIEAAGIVDASPLPITEALHAQLSGALFEASIAPRHWAAVTEIPMSAGVDVFALAPEGGRIAAQHFERPWDNALLWGEDADFFAALAHHGQTFAAGDTWVIRVYAPGSPDTLALRGLDCGANELRFSTDGALLWARCEGGQQGVWASDSGALLFKLDDDRSLPSPDLRTIVAGEGDGLVLWDTTRAAITARFDGLVGPPSALALSADGRKLAAADAAEVRVWSTGDAAALARFEHQGVASLVFHLDGARLSSVDATQELRTWSLASGEGLVARFEPPKARHKGFEASALHELAVSPDGRRLALYVDRRVWIWDAHSGELLLDEVDWSRSDYGTFGLAPARPDPLAFTPDGERLLVRRRDGRAQLYDSEAGSSLAVLGLCLACSLSSDGTGIVSAGLGLAVWDARTGAPHLRLEGRSTRFAAFSPDSATIVEADGARLRLRQNLPPSTQIRALEVDAKLEAGVVFAADGGVFTAEGPVLRRHTLVSAPSPSPTPSPTPSPAPSPSPPTSLELRAPITALASLPATAPFMLVSGDSEGQLSVWAGEYHQPSAVLEGHDAPVERLAVAETAGSSIASAAADGSVRLWSLEHGVLRAGQLISTHERITGLDLSADARVLLTADERSVRLWDVHSGETLGEWTPSEGTLELATLARDASRVATCNAGSEIRVWDRHGQLLLEFHGRRADQSLVFSPDGTRLATANSLWALPSGERLTDFEHSGPSEGYPAPAIFSPDGALLVADGAIWDGESGELVSAPWGVHHVQAQAFSPDGTRLALLGRERLLIRAPQSPLTLACAQLADIPRARARVAAICDAVGR